MRSLVQRVDRCPDRLLSRLRCILDLLETGEGTLDLLEFTLFHLVGVLLETRLGGITGLIGFISNLDQFAGHLVLLSKPLRFLTHLLDLSLAETGRRLDLDGLLLAGSQILGTDFKDSVCIDVEGDLDLRNTPGSCRNSVELELAEGSIISRHLPLTLEDMDVHSRLIVCSGREDLLFLVRDGRVALDEFGGHSTESLDPQRERSDIK